MTKRPLRPIKEQGVYRHPYIKSLADKIHDDIFMGLVITFGIVCYPIAWTLRKIYREK